MCIKMVQLKARQIHHSASIKRATRSWSWSAENMVYYQTAMCTLSAESQLLTSQDLFVQLHQSFFAQSTMPKHRNNTGKKPRKHQEKTKKTEPRIPERHYVHCLQCKLPQDKLSVHLSRVCMKNSTPAEITEEVKKARASLKQWIRFGRIWDYNDLAIDIPQRASRIAIVKKFKELGFFVINMPPASDVVLEPETSTSAATASVDTIPAARETSATAPSTSHSICASGSESNSSSSDEDDGTEDPSWEKDLPKVTTSVRSRMLDAGLYDKFAEDTPLLVDFKKYLNETLSVQNCQQEVDNVSRFLRYLQPTGDEPTTDFVSKSRQTRDYISSLRQTDMAATTIIKYLKNMIRFIKYLKTRLDLTTPDKDFQDNLQAYKELLQTLKKPVSKAHSKDVCKTSNNRMVEGIRSVRDCQDIFKVARDDFLSTVGKFINKETVTDMEKTNFRYYCEALLVLRHFLRPGPVEGMTVHDWSIRKAVHGRVVIGVSQHKTATMQVAAFALTEEEETWFQAYFENIRPTYISNDCDKFFISSTGNQVHSVTNDVARLHDSYNITPVTSHEVRKAVETEAALLFSDTQKENVRHYLVHSTEVAQQHDRMRVGESVASTAELLDTLRGTSLPNQSSPSDPPERANKPKGTDFTAFARVFPVTKHGQPPSKKARVEAGFPDDRINYDKWRACQYTRRQHILLSKFSSRKPVVRKVQKLIEKQGWTANCPKAEEIVKLWAPHPRLTIQTDPQILKCVSPEVERPGDQRF